MYPWADQPPQSTNNSSGSIAFFTAIACRLEVGETRFEGFFRASPSSTRHKSAATLQKVLRYFGDDETANQRKVNDENDLTGGEARILACRRSDVNYWHYSTYGGEAGIRTLGRVLKTLQRFSKPPPSASRPPHRGPVSI